MDMDAAGESASRLTGATSSSAPTSRWSLTEMRTKLAPLLLQTARAASLGQSLLRSA